MHKLWALRGGGQALPTQLRPYGSNYNLHNMSQASIHFEPVKGGSEEHNKRLKFLDYVLPERTHLNEYRESDTQAHRLAIITQNFLDHHPKRKKLHAKATPIREAVVNIEEHTTMDDLKNLAKRLRDRFGIEIFQIAIHKDEGYFNSEDGDKLNLHAHLVADWTNHEIGESLKLSRQDMAEMQTITAEVLGMKRGVSSDKKHLTAMQYKEKKAREEAEKAIQTKEKAAVEAQKWQQKATEAEKAATDARSKQKAAEAAAIGGFIVGGANKLANKWGFGKEAKLLKELPQQLATAKEEGRAEGKKEAIAEVLKEAKLNFGDKEVTTSMIGRDWKFQFGEAKKWKDAAQKGDRLKDQRLNLFLSVPIIAKALEVLKSFVFHLFDGFSTEDKQILAQALQGDASKAHVLRELGEAYGGIVGQNQYWSRWNEAERQMEDIANGKNLDQRNQERTQGRGWNSLSR